MASIIKRKKNYSVVYNYVDENGETKQKWETWHTHKEALKRKAEIENQQHTGTFLPPSNQTITEFLYDFVYTGEVKPEPSIYCFNNSPVGFMTGTIRLLPPFPVNMMVTVSFKAISHTFKSTSS